MLLLVVLAFAVLVLELSPITRLLYGEAVRPMPGGELRVVGAILTRWAVDFVPGICLLWWSVHEIARGYDLALKQAKAALVCGLVVYLIYFGSAIYGSFLGGPLFDRGPGPLFLGLLLSAVKSVLFFGVVTAVAVASVRAERSSSLMTASIHSHAPSPMKNLETRDGLPMAPTPFARPADVQSARKVRGPIADVVLRLCICVVTWLVLAVLVFTVGGRFIGVMFYGPMLLLVFAVVLSVWCLLPLHRHLSGARRS